MQSDNGSIPYRRLNPVLAGVRWCVRMARVCLLKALYGKKMTMAEPARFVIGKGWNITVPNYFQIDKNVGVGAYFMSQTNVRIGPDCLLSSRVSFIGHDHDIKGSDSAFLSGRNAPSTTVLEGNNFIGFGATLCGNVTLGSGAIVGAHSLVLESVPSNAVVAGVPAKIVGTR